MKNLKSKTYVLSVLLVSVITLGSSSADAGLFKKAFNKQMAIQEFEQKLGVTVFDLQDGFSCNSILKIGRELQMASAAQTDRIKNKLAKVGVRSITFQTEDKVGLIYKLTRFWADYEKRDLLIGKYSGSKLYKELGMQHIFGNATSSPDVIAINDSNLALTKYNWLRRTKVQNASGAKPIVARAYQEFLKSTAEGEEFVGQMVSQNLLTWYPSNPYHIVTDYPTSNWRQGCDPLSLAHLASTVSIVPQIRESQRSGR